MPQVSILTFLGIGFVLALFVGAITNNNPSEGFAYTLKRGIKLLLALTAISLMGLFLLDNPSFVKDFFDFLDDLLESVF